MQHFPSIPATVAIERAEVSSSNKPDRSWLLFERVARSLAHSVGNAINVVSGRLSILELESSLSEESRRTVSLTRERLRELHNDLQGALDFGQTRSSNSPHSFIDSLCGLNADNIEIEGLKECGNIRTIADARGFDAELGVRYLRDAYQKLSAENARGWTLRRMQVASMPELTLALCLVSQLAPPQRRALMEPWFSNEARELDSEARYARLLLAQALGAMEAGGAKLVVEPSDEGRENAVTDGSAPTRHAWTSVRICWPMEA